MSDIEMADGAAPHDDPEASDEGEGDDIAADINDSSDEEATDEEEIQEVAQGFIVDDDDDEEGSDAEEAAQKKRRKRRRKRGLSLEADDLDLVAENTGRKVTSRPELSRIRRGRASPAAAPIPRPSARAADLSDSGSEPPDINDIFNDAGRAGRGGADDMDLDDMDAFIDDDDDDDAAEMGEEERAQRRAERKRSEQQRKKAMDSRPELAEVDPGAWDEIFDVFGNGDDYDWALDDDEEGSDTENALKDMRYQDVFEPSEIAARFLTADDDVIRATDVPERMQLSTSALSPQATLGTSVLSSPFPESEISSAAEWVATRLSARVRDDFYRPNGQHHELLAHLIVAVTNALRFILIEYLEVPYIWAHRRDHISLFEPPKRVVLLDRDELWRIANLASKYRALHARKQVLDTTFERMHVDDRYYDIDIAPNTTSVDAVTDAMEWLALMHKKAYQDAVELEVEGDIAGARQKKPSRVSSYDIAKNSVLSELSNSFGITSIDIVRNVVQDRRQYFTEDQATTPLVFAEAFINSVPGGPSTPEDALATARMIIATELGKDPQLRQLTRERFKTGAVVSIKPTEKGINKIDDQHPYASFKYLLNKSVQNMLSDAQWLHILAAEADHLITIDISLSVLEESNFREALMRAFKSDGFSDIAKAWNHQRAQVVEEVVEKHLYAVGVKFVREWLRDEVEEMLAGKCSAILEQRIDVAPFRPKEFEKGEVPAVLAVSWGKGDPQKDAIYTVFMDEQGHVREHTKFDNLMDPDARSDFSELIKRRKPDVVAVGGFSILTVKLWERVREVIGYEEHQDSSGRDGDNPSNGNGPDGADAYGGPSTSTSSPKDLVPVIWVPDQVARIFQHSKRAVDEFGSLPTIGRYCAGLARYIQSPLNEYAALGADIAAISFHDDQQLLPPEKLLSALERSLVSVVNDVGVDINKAVTESYYRHLLPFVAGLGPRKAQAMLKKIGQLGGTVLNREQFITEGILTAAIFVNAAGFLKISQDDYEESSGKKGYEASRKQDPLDSTRIHPEDYDLARKMASGALELDEEDFANLHPSAPVAQLMQDENIQTQLNSLGLDEFAENLWHTNEERKRYTLDVIHNELLNPFGELRPDFEPMSDWEVVTMLTGETKRTLIPGRVLTVTVARIRKDQVDARLDSGLEGTISKDYLTATGADPNQVVKLRQSLQAVVVSVDVNPGPRVRVHLASRGDAIKQADIERPKRFDKDYDHSAARQAQELQERKQRSEANRARRVIKHPAFKNFGSKEAENYLAPLQHGDAVIRPSSKGPDHLAVTWKVADGVYQHLDVVEPNAEGPPNPSGAQFIIENQYFYSDLDDLLVNHVKAMSRKVDDLMASEKYKGGSDQDLHNWLTNFVKMNPNRSSYAFGLNRQRAGFFNLSFLANINAPLQTWQVKVTPTAYRLGEVEVGSVPDLCDAFKRKHQKDMKTLANGGKTPYGAGRATPGRNTGVTPGYGTAYGKTPNPYQPKTPAYNLGKTPNPHAPPMAMASMPLSMAPPPPPSIVNAVPAGMNPERWRQMQAQARLGGASPAAPSPGWRQ